MPHALLDGAWPSDAPFEKLVVAAPEGHVIVHEATAPSARPTAGGSG
jgi:hypothetical protein